MEPIELPILSPRADLTGIQQAVAGLEQLDRLLGRIASNSRIGVSLNISGGEGIRAMAASFDDLLGTLNEAGKSDWAARLSKGGEKPKAMLADLRKEIETTERAVQELSDKWAANQSKLMSRQDKGSNRLNEGDKEYHDKNAQFMARNEELRKQIAAANQQIARLSRAEGLSKSLDMTFADSRKSLSDPAAVANINAQTAAVSKLNTEEKKLVETREKAVKAGVLAPAPSNGGLLSVRTLQDSEGAKFTTNKYRTGQGVTQTNRPDGSIVEDRSFAGGYREQARALEADFRAKAAALAQAGYGRGSAQRNAALAGYQGQLSDLAAKMQNEGLDNSALRSKVGGIGTQLGDAGIATTQKQQKEQERAQKAKQQEDARREKQAALEAQRAEAERQQALKTKMAQDAQRERQAAAEERRLKADSENRQRLQQKAREDEEKRMEQSRQFAGLQANAAANRAQFGGLQGDESTPRTSRGIDGSTTTTRTKAGKRFTETVDASGNITKSSIADIASVEKAHKSLGSQFVANTTKVAMWTASVGTLYAALGAIKAGFSDAFDLDRKFATLQAVFKGTAEEARGLMDATLRMGAAHGRSAAEAVDAATEWSRAQLSAAQAGEALRVSLTAANVAEISSAEAGKNLAAIYQTNSLRVTELSGVLGMMNTVSNTTKTTTKDLLDGFAQVGPLASEAGISIAKTNALIGVTVAATARSGSQIGTSMKALVVSMSDPRIQDYLRSRFGIESRTNNGDIKSGQEQIDDLFVKTRGMNRSERGEMLVNVAGKHQASKIEAMLENYPEAARKAIESQLDLNSAQREQEKILDTTSAKWETLKTQWSSAFDALHQGITKTPINWMLQATGDVGARLGIAAERWSSSTWAEWDQKGRNIDRSYALGYDEQIAQGDIQNINSAGSRAAANKDIQAFIMRTVQTSFNAPKELFAKDAKQLAMTLEKNPEKQAALLAQMTGNQSDSAALAKTLSPYYQKASITERNSLVAEKANREFAMQKADMLESQLTGPEFAGEDARSKQNLQRQKAMIELLREAGKDQTRSTFSEDESGRRAAQLITPVQETAAAIAASRNGARGLLGDGYSYRLRGMSEVSAATARLDGIRGVPGSSTEDVQKAREDVLNARANLRVAGTRDADMASRLSFDADFARNSGGATEGLSAMRRAEFLGGKRNEALAGGVFGDRGREVQLVEATTAALREQRELTMQIARTEADIVTARERQNIEASKALQMASREDQARSIMLKGFTERNGPMSPERFQFMSSDFRNAAVRMNPESVPGALTGVGDMEQNLASMREASAKMAEVVGGLIPLATAATTMLDQRDAKLRFDIEVNVSDALGEAARAFGDLATARLNEVLGNATRELDKVRDILSGRDAGEGVGAVGF